MSRYRLALLLALVSLAVAACGQQSAPAGGQGGGQSGAVNPVFAFSEAVVGKNRVALGLVRNNTPVNDPGAEVKLRFFDLNDTSATVKFESDATYYGQGLPAAVYVAYPTFDSPGEWGVEVQVRLSDQAEATTRRLRLNVLPASAVPNVGDRAISVRTLTVGDVPDPAQLTSDGRPDPALYQISLDDALASGRPTALLFATPAFCRTATCGPSLQVFQTLQKTYGDRMNFIHVEVYRYPFGESFDKINKAALQASNEQRGLTDAELRAGFAEPMVAWRLTTEPWLYLIDGQGTIVARFEGGITSEELGPMLDKLAAGQPVL